MLKHDFDPVLNQDLSPAQLRKLSLELREAGRRESDLTIKRLFAQEALILAERAEALERQNKVR